MMKKKWKILLLLPVLSLIMMAFQDPYFEIVKNLEIFTKVYQELQKSYVDELSPGEMMQTGMDAMMKDLDPYTVYIPETKVEEFRIQSTGSFAGVGMQVFEREKNIYIGNIIENSPAHEQGLKIGDQILALDGEKLHNKTPEEIDEKLNGQAGSEIEVSYRRFGDSKTQKIELKRREIVLKSIPYYGWVGESIAYVDLTKFDRACGAHFQSALEELKAENDMEGVIIDLRGNPGGLLIEAVRICNLFLPNNKIVVSTRGKDKSAYQEFKTSKNPWDEKIPVVVLIDESSASASEIVSGTLQDYDRAVILGTRSFGKGLVQKTVQMPYNSQLKVTIAKYYTPSGRCIQAIDYGKKTADGSREKLPDHLRTAFKTANGRIVYDGGGVDPDLIVEKDSFPESLGGLVYDYFLFDFITEYSQKVENKPSIEDFKVDDALFEKFQEYVAQKEFSYTTQLGEQIKEIEKSLEKEGILKENIAHLEALKVGNIKNEKNTFKEEKIKIKRLLLNDISNRWYFASGRSQLLLKEDNMVQAAIRVLKDNKEYADYLKARK